MTPEEIKTQLDALIWSQADLARRLGVAPNTVYRWAAGLLPVPAWLAGYLDMALMIHRCVTGQALMTVNDAPVAIFALADRIGVAYSPQLKEQQRQYEERLRLKEINEWLPRDEP